MGSIKHIAVTGATGFLGKHICERLICDGYMISILSRDAHKTKNFDGRAARIVVGDIADQMPLMNLSSVLMP